MSSNAMLVAKDPQRSGSKVWCNIEQSSRQTIEIRNHYTRVPDCVVLSCQALRVSLHNGLTPNMGTAQLSTA